MVAQPPTPLAGAGREFLFKQACVIGLTMPARSGGATGVAEGGSKCCLPLQPKPLFLGAGKLQMARKEGEGLSTGEERFAWKRV